MSVKKQPYVNENKDGFKKENQSPLSPPWMLSGKQNEGKVLVGGKNGFVEWGEGGGSGGTDNYNLLNNKPRLNGVELIGDTTLNYLANAVISADNKSLTLNDNTGQSKTFTPPTIDAYTKQEVDNLLNQIRGDITALTNTLNNDYYTKTNIDAKVIELNNTINSKTSDAAHYAKNKLQLLGSENITLDKNDTLKTIKIEYSATPVPPEPAFDGIFSWDQSRNRWIMYNPDDLFINSQDQPINYYKLDSQSSEPPEHFSWHGNIPRNQFNVELKIIDQRKNFNGRTYFLAYCLSFNQPLNFLDCNWDQIGSCFMQGCIAFNSNITFPPSIISVGNDFMKQCSAFNKTLQSLFEAPALRSISTSFLDSCYNFDTNINLSNVPNDLRIDGRHFMSNCKKMFTTSRLQFGSKTLDQIKAMFTFSNDDGVHHFLGVTDSTAQCYTDGIYIEASDLTKSDFNNISYDISGTAYYPFRNRTVSPYKKILVNGAQ